MVAEYSISIGRVVSWFCLALVSSMFSRLSHHIHVTSARRSTEEILWYKRCKKEKADFADSKNPLRQFKPSMARLPSDHSKILLASKAPKRSQKNQLHRTLFLKAEARRPFAAWLWDKKENTPFVFGNFRKILNKTPNSPSLLQS